MITTLDRRNFEIAINIDKLDMFKPLFDKIVAGDPNVLLQGTEGDQASDRFYSLIGLKVSGGYILSHKILEYLISRGGNIRYCGNSSSLRFFKSIERTPCKMAFLAYHGIRSLNEFYVLVPEEGSEATTDQFLYANRAQHGCEQVPIALHENAEDQDSPEVIFQYYRGLVDDIKRLERQISESTFFTDRCQLHFEVARLFENLAKTEFTDWQAYEWAIHRALEHYQAALENTRWIDARKEQLGAKVSELEAIMQWPYKVSFSGRKSARIRHATGPDEAKYLSFHERRMSEITAHGDVLEILQPTVEAESTKPAPEQKQVEEEDGRTNSTDSHSSQDPDQGDEAKSQHPMWESHRGSTSQEQLRSASLTSSRK